MTRAQLPMAAIEAALAVLLVVGVAAGFALDAPDADTREPQLEAYASDAVTILANEPPRHRSESRLSEITASADAFDRERAALERRLAGILPDNVMFEVETRYGAVGHPKPDRVATGDASATTRHGTVTLRVWFA